jgi:hypothetical protein
MGGGGGIDGVLPAGWQLGHGACPCRAAHADEGDVSDADDDSGEALESDSEAPFIDASSADFDELNLRRNACACGNRDEGESLGPSCPVPIPLESGTCIGDVGAKAYVDKCRPCNADTLLAVDAAREVLAFIEAGKPTFATTCAATWRAACIFDVAVLRSLVV